MSDRPTMLIAEPSALIAGEIGRSALVCGLEPVVAKDFRAAIGVVLDRPPRVIVSSVELAGMPGGSLDAAVRASPAHGAIPVLFVTAAGGAPRGVNGRPVLVKDPTLGAHLVDALESLGFARVGPPGVERASGPSINGRRILIAEDLATTRRLLAHRLHARGAIVTLATDGVEAGVEALRSVHDVILLDIEMPRLDGRDVVRLIRESGLTTPVLAMTAHDDPATVRDLCETHGFDGVVSKAGAVEAVVRTLEQSLTPTDRRGGPDAANMARRAAPR